MLFSGSEMICYIIINKLTKKILSGVLASLTIRVLHYVVLVLK